MLERYLSTIADFDSFHQKSVEQIPELVRLDCAPGGGFRSHTTGFMFESGADATTILTLAVTRDIFLDVSPSPTVRLIIPTSASFEVTFGSTVRTLAAGGPAALMPVRDLRVHQKFGHHICLCMDRRHVAAALHEVDCDADLADFPDDLFVEPRLPGLQTVALEVRRLIELLDGPYEALIDVPAFRRANEQLLQLRLAAVLAQAVETGRRSAPAPNSTAVSRAEDYIRAHADGDIDLAALARHAGCSLRSLQIYFRATFDCTIVQFIQRQRLANARRRLEQAEPARSIAEIARQSGFTHLGQFAKVYRSAFGEQPRDTLFRARVTTARR